MPNISLKIRPLTVPNFVVIDVPPGRVPKYETPSSTLSVQISELDEETLAQLCDDFKKSLFEKAGKVDRK